MGVSMQKKWIKTGAAISLAFFLGACANHSSTSSSSDISQFKPKVRCSANVDPENQVGLEMVDTLMARGRNYAALATLQDNKQESQEYWRRYGQLLAKTGDLDRARLIFEELKEKCGNGEAYHGLGMVALKNGDLSQSIPYFERALNLLPASPSIRNDYGYALMLAGDDEAAQLHLRTALELENGKGKSRQNLAIAYYLAGNQKGLRFLKNEYGYTDRELSHAEKMASQIGR
jgi:tetratricopeptide (TPR) repeat protein